MGTRVALEHYSRFSYPQPVFIYPHTLRLHPVAHNATPIEQYRLSVEPEPSISWREDADGNRVAKTRFSRPSTHLEFRVDLVAHIGESPRVPTTETPSRLKRYHTPVKSEHLAAWLKPYLDAAHSPEHALSRLAVGVRDTVRYTTRYDEHVRNPDEILAAGEGSCRDAAWLLVAALRHLGYPARFVTGYLVQLAGSLISEPPHPEHDVVELHAWAEFYLAGRGWVGVDGTSGRIIGPGYIPLFCSPTPEDAAPISGGTDPTEVSAQFHAAVHRLDS